MRLLLDDLAGVIAADVARDLLGAGDHAHGGRHSRAASAGAARACAESSSCCGRSARTGVLPETTGAHHVGLEGMRGQRQEPRLLLGEDVGDGPIALLGMRALMRDVVAPAPKLRVQIVDIDKRARRKEGVAQVLNLALDFPLLIGRAPAYTAAARSDSGRRARAAADESESRCPARSRTALRKLS